jgi:hypothetical protein
VSLLRSTGFGNGCCVPRSSFEMSGCERERGGSRSSQFGRSTCLANSTQSTVVCGIDSEKKNLVMIISRHGRTDGHILVYAASHHLYPVPSNKQTKSNQTKPNQTKPITVIGALEIEVVSSH